MNSLVAPWADCPLGLVPPNLFSLTGKWVVASVQRAVDRCSLVVVLCL